MASKSTSVNLANLTKDALAGLIVDQVDGLTKSKAKEILDAVFGNNEGGGIIGNALKRGSTVTISGFGKFLAVKKPATKARPGTNPFTQEAITIKARPATTVVKFRVGKATKEHVAGAKKK